jgi:hypothetical protein
MHQVVQRGAADAQQFGGLDDVAVDAPQRGNDGAFLGLVADAAQVQRAVSSAGAGARPMSSA